MNVATHEGAQQIHGSFGRPHQAQPDPNYSGPLLDLSVTEAQALFHEVIDYFLPHPRLSFPLPPGGLPGFRADDYDADEPAAELLVIGMRYLQAIAKDERRAMHLRWDEAREFIRAVEAQAVERVWQEIGERSAAKHMAEAEAKSAVPTFVYFIGAGSGPVKIGFATRPSARLSDLQTSHHEKLSLLATLRGDLALEKAYHKRFAAHRLSGEWFTRAPEIEAEIDRLNALSPTPPPGVPTHARD